MDIDSFERDWQVTPEKIEEAIELIIAAANPLQIILFGSRARGDNRPDSDVDLAIILDVPEEKVDIHLPYLAMRRIKMSADLIAVSKTKYDLHRPWLNSVFNYIDREGIVLYDREHPEFARSNALHFSGERRIDPAISAA